MLSISGAEAPPDSESVISYLIWFDEMLVTVETN